MSKRQFGLTAIAILLLSPTLVSANESLDATHLTVGKVQINTNNHRTSINTPNIQLDTPTTTDSQLLLSRRQRARTPVRKRTPAVIRPRVDIDDDNEPIVISFPSQGTPTIPSMPISAFSTFSPDLDNSHDSNRAEFDHSDCQR